MAFGYSPDAKLEVAIYVAGPMTGLRCGNPEGRYGDRAHETDDLVWYEGTEAELRAIADDLEGTALDRHANVIREYLA